MRSNLQMHEAPLHVSMFESSSKRRGYKEGLKGKHIINVTLGFRDWIAIKDKLFLHLQKLKRANVSYIERFEEQSDEKGYIKMAHFRKLLQIFHFPLTESEFSGVCVRFADQGDYNLIDYVEFFNYLITSKLNHSEEHFDYIYDLKIVKLNGDGLNTTSRKSKKEEDNDEKRSSHRSGGSESKRMDDEDKKEEIIKSNPYGDYLIHDHTTRLVVKIITKGYKNNNNNNSKSMKNSESKFNDKESESKRREGESKSNESENKIDGKGDENKGGDCSICMSYNEGKSKKCVRCFGQFIPSSFFNLSTTFDSMDYNHKRNYSFEESKKSEESKEEFKHDDYGVERHRNINDDYRF